jgi:hypothetical protein
MEQQNTRQGSATVFTGSDRARFARAKLLLESSPVSYLQRLVLYEGLHREAVLLGALPAADLLSSVDRLTRVHRILAGVR